MHFSLSLFLFVLVSLQFNSPSISSQQAITGDAVLLKFEKTKSALIDSLRRVEDIVPSSIGSQVMSKSVNSSL